MSENDRSYFRLRAEAESARAAAAANPEVALVHSQLELAYRDRLRAIDPNDRIVA